MTLNYKETLEKARKEVLDRKSQFAPKDASEQVAVQKEGLMRPSSYAPQPAKQAGGVAGGMGLAVLEQLKEKDEKAMHLATEEMLARKGRGAWDSSYMGGSSTVPDSKTAGRIRGKLMDRGMPSHVADAFIVNFQDESGLNSGINEANPIVEGSRGGFGFYQLTGPRRTAYEAFAKQRGVNPSDEDSQLDWLMMELEGSEKKAGNAIYNTNNTSDAAVAIVNQFLRPAKKHAVSRTANYRNL
jgi:hypothetical protein